MFDDISTWLAPFWSAAADVLKRHSTRSSLRMSLSALDRVLWQKIAQGSLHEVRNVALCSLLDFVFPLCIPSVPVGHIRADFKS